MQLGEFKADQDEEKKYVGNDRKLDHRCTRAIKLVLVCSHLSPVIELFVNRFLKGAAMHDAGLCPR